MTYAVIAQQIVETSRARGSVASTWDTAPIRMKGLDAEIGELVRAMKLQDLRERVRESSLESADVAAFALLLMHDLGNAQWHFRASVQKMGPVCDAAEVLVEPLREYSDRAYEAWRRGAKTDVFISLEILVAHVVDLRTRCLRLPNELHFDLQMVMAKNRGRCFAKEGKDERS